MIAPHIARDGRWLMNLFDPDLTRAEVMIGKPVQYLLVLRCTTIDETR